MAMIVCSVLAGMAGALTTPLPVAQMYCRDAPPISNTSLAFIRSCTHGGGDERGEEGDEHECEDAFFHAHRLDRLWLTTTEDHSNSHQEAQQRGEGLGTGCSMSSVLLSVTRKDETHSNRDKGTPRCEGIVNVKLSARKALPDKVLEVVGAGK